MPKRRKRETVTNLLAEFSEDVIQGRGHLYKNYLKRIRGERKKLELLQLMNVMRLVRAAALWHQKETRKQMEALKEKVLSEKRGGKHAKENISTH